MPYLLRQRITKESDLDDNTTWRYKLPSTGKYTALEMRINCDRFATRASGTVVYPLESCISKIEILAGGSRALLSVTGQQLDALNYWDFGRPTPRRYRQEASTGNDINLYLMGGRDLHDMRYGWDFERLGECYLEYTYDLNEGDAEYFKANDHDVSLYGWRWMGTGAPSFAGYFRSRQLANWTTTATSALKTIDIPTGNPIRRIGVQAKTRTATLGGTFTELEVRVNEGEYSPVDIKSPMDWTMQEVIDYGLHNTIGGIDYVIGTGESDLPYWWSYLETVEATPYAAGEINLQVQGITLPPKVTANTTGNAEVMFTMRGWGFQKCLRVGFDRDYDGLDFLTLARGDVLDVVLTEAAASKDCALFVQDVLSY